MATATVKTQLVPQPPIVTPVPDKVERVGVTLELTTGEATALRILLGDRVSGNGRLETGGIWRALDKVVPRTGGEQPGTYELHQDGRAWGVVGS